MRDNCLFNCLAVTTFLEIVGLRLQPRPSYRVDDTGENGRVSSGCYPVYCSRPAPAKGLRYQLISMSVYIELLDT